MKGEEWGSGGFSPEKFLSHAPFRSKERLFWKPLSHGHPMLVVKNSQYKFKRSRPHEIFDEKLKKEKGLPVYGHSNNQSSQTEMPVV